MEPILYLGGWVDGVKSFQCQEFADRYLCLVSGYLLPHVEADNMALTKIDPQRIQGDSNPRF